MERVQDLLLRGDGEGAAYVLAKLWQESYLKTSQETRIFRFLSDLKEIYEICADEVSARELIENLICAEGWVIVERIFRIEDDYILPDTQIEDEIRKTRSTRCSECYQLLFSNWQEVKPNMTTLSVYYPTEKFLSFLQKNSIVIQLFPYPRIRMNVVWHQMISKK